MKNCATLFSTKSVSHFTVIDNDISSKTYSTLYKHCTVIMMGLSMKRQTKFQQINSSSYLRFSYMWLEMIKCFRWPWKE